MSGNTEKKWYSPYGELIVLSKETLYAYAGIKGIDPDTFQPEYTGSSDVDWDSQNQVTKDGQAVYVDNTGEEWRFDELLYLSEEEWEAKFGVASVAQLVAGKTEVVA